MENKVTIEVNAKDAPAIELILRELELARLKHCLRWKNMTKQQQLAAMLEENSELIQSLNKCLFGVDDETKIEAAQYAVTAIRFLTGD